MENDLSKCAIGSWIATTEGWKQVKRSHNYAHTYPINIGERSYTLDGKVHACDIVPSALVDPPNWLLEYIGPKPCEFEKDDPVLVWNTGDIKFYMHFSHMEGGKYICFADGRTSYTTDGKVDAWTHCRKAVAGEDY